MNITASVFVNDDEPGLHHDFEVWLEKLAPEKPYSQYEHNGFEDNADAHLKRQIMGREVVAAITNGKLDFGTWEQIFYGEFDGKREKRRAGQNHRRIGGDVDPAGARKQSSQADRSGQKCNLKNSLTIRIISEYNDKNAVCNDKTQLIHMNIRSKAMTEKE